MWQSLGLRLYFVCMKCLLHQFWEISFGHCIYVKAKSKTVCCSSFIFSRLCFKSLYTLSQIYQSVIFLSIRYLCMICLLYICLPYFHLDIISIVLSLNYMKLMRQTVTISKLVRLIFPLKLS